MPRSQALLAALLAAWACSSCRALRPAPAREGGEQSPGALTTWPALGSTARPWAIWWWPGSAVENKEIEAHLDRYAAAGLGGVHVVPIYGVRGAEGRALPFLGADWVERLRFTVAAARTRGLGVDVSTGTGWPFGGPTVAANDGSRRAIVQRLPGPGGPYALVDAPTGMKVKRAAPGGEGLVVDLLSAEALPRYLSWFDQAFRGGGPPGVRAFTSDSSRTWAATSRPTSSKPSPPAAATTCGCNCPALAGEGDAEVAARVLADYRETVSDLLLERGVRPWVAWSHAQGSLARNQAHGAPGNLLDLYAAADIPETEAFGPSHFPFPGCAPNRNCPPTSASRTHCSPSWRPRRRT